MKFLTSVLLILLLASCSSVRVVGAYKVGCNSTLNETVEFFSSQSNQIHRENYLNGAISCDKLDTVIYMVENNVVNVNGNNGGKSIPLEYATARDKKDVVKYILDHSDFNASLSSQLNKALKSAVFTDIEMLKLLIMHGGDVNYSDNGQSVLREHVIFGTVKTVQYLIENGADIKSEDRNLVAYALSYKKEKTAIYLIENGFEFIGVEKSPGWTPIKIAVKGGMVDVVTIMLNKLPNDASKLSIINEALNSSYVNSTFVKPKMLAALQTQKELTLAKL